MSDVDVQKNERKNFNKRIILELIRAHLSTMALLSRLVW